MLDSTLPPRPVNRLLWLAAAAGVEDEVRRHIALGNCLEWRDKRGFSPLMAAASRDRSGICQLLLDAGVDPWVRDVEGRDALAIAYASGSQAAVETIERWISARTAGAIAALPTAAPQASEAVRNTSDLSCSSTPIGLEIHQIEPTSNSTGTASETEMDPMLEVSLDGWEPAELSATPQNMPEFVRMEEFRQRRINQHQAVDTRVSWEELDDPAQAAWEPVAETMEPPENPELVQIEALKHSRIEEHAPANLNPDWEDLAIDLPKRAKSLPSPPHTDFRARFRWAALLALREGSVPRFMIEDLLSHHEEAEIRDLAAEKLLLVALGAETDERSAHQLGTELFYLLDRPESEEEEHEIDDALEFFEDLQSGHNDPLRIYLKSLSNRTLLTTDQEIKIAQAMEAQVERALDALAIWPAGLQALFAAVSAAKTVLATLGSIVAIARDAAEEHDSDVDLNERRGESSTQDTAGQTEIFDFDSVGPAADAIETFTTIHRMAETLGSEPSIAISIRTHLRTLRFRRPFLIKLADLLSEDSSAEARSYRDAISKLLMNRDEMARANLRLVYATAKHYIHTGVPLDDLIQEGNLGLLKAIDRFDWHRGFKFSTMAIWWIKQQINRSIADTAFLIRPPVHVHEKILKLRGLARNFENSKGREANQAERAALLGISIQKLEIMVRPSSEPISIEDAETLDILDIETPHDPMESLAQLQTERLISEKLSRLPRKQEAIVRMRTGIGISDVLTLEQIGSRLEVTRERVRQIEAKARRTLTSSRSREELAAATGRPDPPKHRTIVSPEGDDEVKGH